MSKPPYSTLTAALRNPPLAEAPPAEAAAVPPVRQRRLWALALGSAAAWQGDPAVSEMAEMIGMIACAGNKTLAKDAIAQMRDMSHHLRARIAPLPASALAKVVRRAEAACGAVLDKGIRVKEVQTSWEQFLACVHVRHNPDRASQRSTPDHADTAP